MLSLRPDGRADGLTARSVGAFTLPGSLVVMSGCGTGLGTHQPGAGLAGFFKSWIAAGASGAIGTLWSIPDDASALFDVFYACFRQGIKPSAALREAQLALLAKEAGSHGPHSGARGFRLGGTKMAKQCNSSRHTDRDDRHDVPADQNSNEPPWAPIRRPAAHCGAGVR